MIVQGRIPARRIGRSWVVLRAEVKPIHRRRADNEAGKRGGAIGGKARAVAIGKPRCVAIAKLAAAARWKGHVKAVRA